MLVCARVCEPRRAAPLGLHAPARLCGRQRRKRFVFPLAARPSDEAAAAAEPKAARRKRERMTSDGRRRHMPGFIKLKKPEKRWGWGGPVQALGSCVCVCACVCVCVCVVSGRVVGMERVTQEDRLNNG